MTSPITGAPVEGSRLSFRRGRRCQAG
jgi:hypothetical protein